VVAVVAGMLERDNWEVPAVVVLIYKPRKAQGQLTRVFAEVAQTA
jgi:hypothetical protein